MSLPTVSVCMVVRDDLPFLKQSISAAVQYADEIVVIDNSSGDGSWEFLMDLQSASTVPILLDRASEDVIPELGFSYLKNKAALKATSDWIHSLDSDEILSAEQRPYLKPFLARTKSPVLSIRTLTFRHRDGITIPQRDGGSRPCEPTDWDWISNNCEWDEMAHRRIYRRGQNVEWKGYIHEELYAGRTNAMNLCQGSDFKHLHFSNFRNWGEPKVKRARYAWMLINAYRKPALQEHTNHWWYESYVPEHKAELEEWAQKYEEMGRP